MEITGWYVSTRVIVPCLTLVLGIALYHCCHRDILELVLILGFTEMSGV
jgi:hypothetical protein